MLDNIIVLKQSTIKIKKEKTIYFDPYLIENSSKDADIIFITHTHYDHFSKEDILRIKQEHTIIIGPKDIKEKAKEIGFKDNQIYIVLPNQHYEINNINISTIPAYNINKNFHPKENNWLGYIIEINNFKYYIAGDTDLTDENQQVKCDVAFLPVGGTYTMTWQEAAKLAKIIKPKYSVPIHYTTIVGTDEDAEKFVKETNGIILRK